MTQRNLRSALALVCAVAWVSGCDDSSSCADEPEGCGVDGGLDASTTDAGTSDAGDDDAGGEDAGDQDAGDQDAGPCGGACDDAHCIDGACVECTPTTGLTDCTGTTTRCLDNECVGCVDDFHCTEPGLARCNLDTHECAPCGASSECEMGVTGRPLCNMGTCVECTIASEEARCGTRACDLVAFACTTNDRGSVDTCEPCLADSECIDGNRCIPLTHDGADAGYYCMPVVPAGGCGLPANRPYTVALADRVSRSGAAAAIYCGINEALTTCEAVLAALDGAGAGCADDTACPDGGRCEPVGIDGTARCTYSCGNASQCPDAIDDPALATCNTGGDRYCGRNDA